MHHAAVVTSAQCFGIGTLIHFEQLREDCVSAFTEKFPTCRLSILGLLLGQGAEWKIQTESQHKEWKNMTQK